MLVVSAASMASPFMPFLGAIPQPSWTLFEREIRASFGEYDRSKESVHEANLVLDFSFLDFSHDAIGVLLEKEQKRERTRASVKKSDSSLSLNHRTETLGVGWRGRYRLVIR